MHRLRDAMRVLNPTGTGGESQTVQADERLWRYLAALQGWQVASSQQARQQDPRRRPRYDEHASGQPSGYRPGERGIARQGHKRVARTVRSICASNERVMLRELWAFEREASLAQDWPDAVFLQAIGHMPRAQRCPVSAPGVAGCVECSASGHRPPFLGGDACCWRR
jgi:hypothetical protein